MIQKLYELIIKRYKLILIFSIAVFAAAVLIAQNIGMDSKMEGMLPKDSQSLQGVNEFSKYFDAQDNVLVVVRGSQSQSYIEALAERLESEKIANNLLYKVDREALKEHVHLYLDTVEYQQLEQELNNSDSPLYGFLSTKNFVSLARLFVARYESADVDEQEKLLNEFVKLFRTDSSLSKEEEEHLFSTMLFGNLDLEREKSEYLVSESGETYLMIIKPDIQLNDFVNSRSRFFSRLQAALDETKAEGAFKIEAGITGGALVQDNEADNTMFNGFFSTALLTFALIIVFIVVSFRRVLLPIAAGYPLLLGAILSTAFAYIAYQNLNMFSISFAVLLLGLGIDFAVHIISRYLEERSTGLALTDAVVNTIKETSRGMIVGAVTTAVAFLTFLAAEFKAFTQMGVISGMGILILCIVMLIVMPAIILLMDKKNRPDKPMKDSEYALLKPLGRAVAKIPLIFIVVIIVIAAFLSGNVWSSEIKTDMSKIYPQDMECLKWLEVVEEDFQYNPNTLMFMTDNMEELQKSVEVLSKREDVKQVESILKYLPEDQEYKIAVIKELNMLLQQNNTSPVQPTEIVRAFKGIMDTADRSGINKQIDGYKAMAQVAEALQGPDAAAIMSSMRGRSAVLASTALDDLLISERAVTIDMLPQSLTSNFVGREGKLSVEVIPSVDIWESEHFNELKQAVTDASGNIPVGMPAVMHEVTAFVKSDMLRISLMCFAALFVILYIMFRCVKEAIIAIVPLFMTIYLTLGLVPVIGGDLNIFSITAFPVLIGIGIDSGVHLLHRIKSSPDKDMSYILAHTGKAIMMTTITTLVGFGSLYFTGHPGLASFGLITVIGMSLCLTITLIMVPALYLLLFNRSKIKAKQ